MRDEFRVVYRTFLCKARPDRQVLHTIGASDKACADSQKGSDRRTEQHFIRLSSHTLSALSGLGARLGGTAHVLNSTRYGWADSL